MLLEIGKIYEGKVIGITKFGAFVELEPGTTGMVHISEVANTFVNEIKEHLKDGQEVKVKVLSINEDGKVSLSIKKAVEVSAQQQRQNNFQRNDKRPEGQRSDRSHSDRAYGDKPRTERRYDNWEPKKVVQPTTFEDMLSKFKQNSEEKQCDLKKIIENKRRSSSPRGSGKR